MILILSKILLNLRSWKLTNNCHKEQKQLKWRLFLLLVSAWDYSLYLLASSSSPAFPISIWDWNLRTLYMVYVVKICDFVLTLLFISLNKSNGKYKTLPRIMSYPIEHSLPSFSISTSVGLRINIRHISLISLDKVAVNIITCFF